MKWQSLSLAALLLLPLANAPLPVHAAAPPLTDRALEPHHPVNIRGALECLVRDGAITREEADGTIAYMTFRYERRQEDLRRVAGLTKEERRAYMARARRERGNVLVEYAAFAGLPMERARFIMNAVHENAKGDKYAARLETETRHA